MNTERKTVYCSSEGKTLKPFINKESFKFDLSIKEDKKYRLFVAGQTNLFYLWRNEPDYPQIYHTITDSLSTNTYKAQYSLDVSFKELKKYEWRTYKKIMWKPILSYLPLTPVGSKWKVGFTVKTENLVLTENSVLEMEIDIYSKTKGISAKSPLQDKKVLSVPIKETLGKWITLSKEITIPEETTSYVGVWFRGCAYTGNVFIESPFLTGEAGYNVLPDFSNSVPGKSEYDWAGQYLSKKDWVGLTVNLNGKEILNGEIGERCHTGSEWEIDLPKKLLAEKNEITFYCTSSYHDALPYTINEVSVLEQDGGDFAVISIPEIANVNKPIALLVNVNKPVGIKLDLGDNFSGKTEYEFTETGLDVILLKAKRPVNNAKFSITYGSKTLQYSIKSIIDKEEDEIITGTGDAIYVDQNEKDFNEFISWYFSNGIGDLITIRPTYRWSTTRTLNKKMWEKFVALMEKAGIKYSHMLDGRELNGINCNPSLNEFKSKNFLGRQLHERDGALIYWCRGKVNGLFDEQVVDLKARIGAEDSEHIYMSENGLTAFHYEGNEIHRFKNFNIERDYKVGAEYYVSRMKEFLKTDKATRHTGPTGLFSYLVKAGCGFVGAETMYASIEPLMASLRGTKYSYNLKKVGVHHALQWYSSPYNTEEARKRYRLALYLSYMLGADEINTEEGLWHIEEYYNHLSRFSDECKGFIKVKQDFNRYIKTNTRAGKLKTGIAFIQGRYDPYNDFVKHQPWGFTDTAYSKVEDSWDLVKIFYPLSVPCTPLYFHNCPTDKPLGYYSGSPYGQVDKIPYDSKAEFLSNYSVLIFSGYNCAYNEQMENIYKFVSTGKKVVLTRAHLTTTTNMKDVVNLNLNYLENSSMNFANGKMIFEKKKVNGEEVNVCINAKPFDKVLLRAEDGTEVAGIYNVNKGYVYMFNIGDYPSNKAINGLYGEVIKDLAKTEIDGQDVKVVCDDNVEYAIYDRENNKDIYLLAVDWYDDVKRKVKLVVDKFSYNVHVNFGVMYKIVTNGKISAYCSGEGGVVVSVKDKILVQGTGKQEFIVLSNGKTEKITVDFSDCPYKEI